MKENLTEIVAILDRSWSMTAIVDDTIGGFNTFVAEQRKAPGDAVLTLAQFDDKYEVVYAAKPLAEVPPLQLIPRGSTALFDAVGRTIASVGQRLAQTPEADRPGKVLFLIMTDGHENASKEFTADDVAKMIRHQTEAYFWGFIFLGANQDAVLTARSIGIAPASSITYGANPKGTSDVLKSAASVARSYRGGGDLSFNADQRKSAMGE